MNGHTRDKRTYLHKAFIAGIVLKGVDSLLEIIGGISLLLISPQSLNNLMSSLLRLELPADPGDFVAGHLAHWARGWSASSHLFAAVYLLWHGAAKLVVVALLLKGKIWAYHAGIIFLLVFIAYQLFRYAQTHSAWLIVLTVFDFVVIYLTWAEYSRVKQHIEAQRTGRN